MDKTPKTTVPRAVNADIHHTGALAVTKSVNLKGMNFDVLRKHQIFLVVPEAICLPGNCKQKYKRKHLLPCREQTHIYCDFLRVYIVLDKSLQSDYL